jgi:hypothetical protein
LHLSPEWALVGVTAILAVFTWLLWRSTGRLARDAKSSADATLNHLEATAERQLRAYVFMERMEIHPPASYATLPDLPQMPVYRTTYKNSGQTPAYDVQIEAAIFLERPEVCTTENWSLPASTDEGMSVGTIAPGAVAFQLYDEKLKADQLQLLRDGTRGLFFAGHISYRDVFSKKRQTNFRLMREPGTHTFSACLKGNNSD